MPDLSEPIYIEYIKLQKKKIIIIGEDFKTK